VVYRGLSGRTVRALSKLKEGDTFTDKAFFSTSADRKVAEKFAFSPIGHEYEAVISVHGVRGVGGAVHRTRYAAEYDGKSEREVLLPRSSTFKVSSIKRDAKGVLQIKVSYLTSEQKKVFNYHTPGLQEKGKASSSSLRERMHDLEIEVTSKKSYTHEQVQKAKKVKIDFDTWIDQQEVLDALEDEAFLFAESISETTAEALREELIEGMQNGESISELQDRIEEIYDGWDGYRAERIARTESARAYSKGHIEAWRSTGVVKNKVWVAASNACPFCLDMDGTTVELDDTFMDEGDTQDVEFGGNEISMSQDYGDVGGPPLHPNCRCAMVAELNDDLGDGDLDED